jgi:hypothetical protein
VPEHQSFSCRIACQSVCRICSGVFRGGGGATDPPLAWSMLEAVRGRPPLAVIRGAVGGVWLVFEEVYGVKWKKCEKLLKRRWSKFFGREFWRLVCVLKKGRQIFWPPPPFEISKYATAYLLCTGSADLIQCPVFDW